MIQQTTIQQKPCYNTTIMVQRATSNDTTIQQYNNTTKTKQRITKTIEEYNKNDATLYLSPENKEFQGTLI